MKRLLVGVMILAGVQGASADSLSGTWLIEHKAAVRLFDCDGGICGSLVWLRKRDAQFPQLCNRTIIWGLHATSGGQWGPGWFYDPEDATTYHVTASQVSPDEITANVYPSIA